MTEPGGEVGGGEGRHANRQPLHRGVTRPEPTRHRPYTTSPVGGTPALHKVGVKPTLRRRSTMAQNPRGVDNLSIRYA